MRTVIVEDEEPILKLMEIVISRNKHLEIIGQFTDSRKALRNIPKLSPDVVFVDVKMPFINGIELSRKIKNFDENIQIVFVTAYEKYAIEAFKVNAVNYILKPITEEDLNVTVNRLLKNMHIRKVISRDNKKNQIFTLGCFRVYGGLENEIIRWSTSKVQELFAYFMCNRGNEADKWNLCDMLWPNFPSKNAEHNLYSTIYRLKIDFKNRGTENIVNYENGKYGINLKNFYCDSWEFEDFIESNPFVNEKNIVSYEKNTALYKGTLFGDNNYSWDADLNEKLRRYYLFSVKNIAKYYMKKKFYNKSEEYLKKAIAVNFFDEEAQELIMKVYFHMGDRIDLVKHYKKLSSALKRQLHVTPKKSTIFPFVTGVTLTDGNGKDVSQETDVDKDSDVNVNYNFSIPSGQTAVKETSYTVQLPDKIKLKSTQADTSVKDSAGTQIGSFTVDTASDKASITFSNDVTGSLSGKFSVSAQFDSSKISNTNPVSIDFGKNSIDVNFKQDASSEDTGSSSTIGQTVSPGDISASADAAAGTDITDTFHFITGVSIKDANGNDLGNDVDKASEIHANYTWSIPNSVDVKSGDYYKMQLPSQIHIAASIDQPINDDTGLKVADMHVDTSGLVTLTFTDYPSTHSNVSGYFYIDCHFEESEIGNNNPVTITFTIPGISNPVKVDVNFEQPKPSITKNVVNGGYDPATDEITWQITVNKENVNVNNASVEDTIADGQVFVPGSVTINGASAADNYDATNKKLTVDLGDITTQQVITFKTSVHDDLAGKGQGSYNYNNTADLNYTDNETPQTIISNTKTVNVPVKLISKTGHYDEVNKKIDWTITVNESGRTINDAVVTDTIPEGLTLIDGSVKVDGAADSNYTMSGQTFTYSLGNITEKKTITFSTSVDQSVYNGNNSLTYTNTAELTGDGVADGTSDSEGVGVSSNIIQKTGSGYDAATGIITWTITVNGNKTNVAAGAKVTDTIPVGQQYVDGSAKLDGTSIGDDGYTVADSGDSAKTGTFIYIFNNAFSDTHTITFQTQVTDGKNYKANYSGKYYNYVNLTAVGIDQDTTGTQQVDSNVITKTGEGYDYSTRQITWKIVVNNNAMPITNAVVTDIIPEGQKYVAGSASIDDGANGSFTTLLDNQVVYTFTGTISKTYNITFKTELTDLDIFNTSGDKTLNNTASITGNEIPTDGNATSTGTQTVKNSVVTKGSTYTKGNSYIDWTVKANANWSIPLAGASITSATITDKLQDGLSLDTDTVELYKATVNADGSLTPGDKVALTADNVKYNPDTGEFDFTFPQDAGTGAFILNFRTNVTKTGNYTNLVEFKGSGVDQSATTTQNGVWFSQGGGGATGETGSIKVIKVSDDGVTPLQGAVFQLLDQYGNVRETSASTGTDGAALFDKLKYDTNYSIKEIKAPTGYNLSSKIYPFQIHNAADQKDITYNFPDTRKTGNVTFTKTGEDSTALSGAEFTLYEPDGKTPVTDGSGSNITATSGSDGKVTFNYDVPYGYKIIETKAPTGYSINSNPLTATVDDSGNVVLDKNTISDSKIRNDVQFTKEDQNGNPLQGAVFKLYKNDDADFENPIQTATSNKDGIVKFTDVAYGYKIKEITPPTGYNPSDKVLTVTMSQDGKSVQLDEDNNTVTDNIMTGNIIFIKVGENSDESGLKGVEFTLYNEDGTTRAVDSSGNVIAPVISDNSGVVKFENVPYGIYEIVETNRPDNYNPYEGNIVADLTQITQNGQDAVITVDGAAISPNNTISDAKIRGNIQFKKTDQSGNPLKGAVFTLYKISEDGKTLTAVKSADGKDLTAVSGADDAEGAAVTTGNVIFSNIEYGNYEIKETTPPSGYYLSSKVLDASITTDGSTVYARPAGDTGSDIYSLSDTRITGGGGSIQGTVSVKKTDDSGNALSGAVFTLYNSSGNPVQTATSDTSGTAQFTKVQPGKYTVKETVAPAGYVLSTQVIPVEINMSKTYDIGTVKDTKNAGTVQVIKEDENGKPLGGAEFTLYDSQGKAVKTAVSGSDGIAVFEDVSYGSYTVKETKAPSGYVLNTQVIDVTIKSSDIQKFTVHDEAEKAPDNNQPDNNQPGGSGSQQGSTGGQSSEGSSNSEEGSYQSNGQESGQSGNYSSQSGHKNVSSATSSNSKLPKTGSFLDTTVLLVVGILFILTGVVLMFIRKKLDKDN